ncbi:MAG: hypothetical protein HC865_02880 [Cyanobacteria bacterium RU_5_0]|nr:hypothetical protein [Cyanobacteria bacterium RU_5_0]
MDSIKAPWKIYRAGKLCAEAVTHREAQGIVKQLSKLYPGDRLYCQYEGRNIAHCGDGGKPL